MKFSVILPVYNTKDYLPVALQSVIVSAVDLEVILVDDGSTDGSGELCDSFAKQDKRIQVIHQENAYVGAARNAGLRAATGEYVYFLDSDDRLFPGTLERVAELSGDVITSTRKLFSDGRAERATYTGTDLREQVQIFSPYVSQNFYRRDWLLRTGVLFSTERKTAEDCEWLFGILQHAERIVTSDLPFYIYTVGRDGSLCTAYRKELIAPTVATWQKLYDAVEKSKYVDKDALRAYCADGLIQHSIYAVLAGKAYLPLAESCLSYFSDKGCKLKNLLWLKKLLGLSGFLRLMNLKMKCKKPL